MKKKIISICLVVALVATAVVGATLAYFTDEDSVENTFTVGDVKINVWENGAITDKDGNVVQEAVEGEESGIAYEGLMPTYKIQKEAYVTNTGKNEAYVRVAVVMNNVGVINDQIDDVYEAKGCSDEEIQAVYDEVFNGWGMSYTKRHVNGANDRRLWMTERPGTPVLFDGQIDMYCGQAGYGMFDVKNTFKSETDTDSEGFDYACKGYYFDAVDTDSRVYVFYLKLDAGESYKLFDGLNVPADFTNEQMAMFEGLKIGVYADAIQTVGFDTAKDAFDALEAEHHIGWWNGAAA